MWSSEASTQDALVRRPTISSRRPVRQLDSVRDNLANSFRELLSLRRGPIIGKKVFDAEISYRDGVERARPSTEKYS